MVGKEDNKFLTGQETRAWRLSRRLSQTELGNWLGISPQAVSKMERRGVSKIVALALAAVDRGLRPARPTEDDYKAVASLVDGAAPEDTDEA